MAQITLKDLFEAFEAGYGLDLEGVQTRETLRNCFDEWLGEDRVDLLGEEDELHLDLDACYEVLNIARQELVDLAFSGNIARLHHLESAVNCFEGIGILIKAEQIVRENLDPRELKEAPTQD